MLIGIVCYVCFFFNDTATTEIYTLSLHDALPIYEMYRKFATGSGGFGSDLNFEPSENFPGVPPLLNFENFEAALLGSRSTQDDETLQDRKSTRLNSSHQIISYAVFCLKKKTSRQLIKTSD